MENQLKVLYVDDEENNLISFKSMFRKLYKVYTAISAQEALQIIENNEMGIIISDQRMPGCTGIQFLAQTIETYPNTIRLLITGQTDIDTVIEAINTGQISKYIQKPWDWDKFTLTLEYCADLYRSRIQLAEKNAQLEKTNDELNRFVYSASHDLRSPLMSVLGIVQYARMEPEMLVAEEYFKVIESSILKLDNYTKRIIEYYQNSRLEEINDVIDFKILVSDCVGSLSNLEPSVVFNVTINQTTNFISDDFRIRVILNNLISNAIKYNNPNTPKHCVTVTVNTNLQGAEIEISDNGIGIPQIYIENIFQLFFRTPTTSKKQGSGIGLFIVKEALEKINGSIKVKSTSEIGTTFNIFIPNKNPK